MDKIILFIDKIISFLESSGLIGGFLLIILESIFPVLPLGVFIGLNTMAYGTVVGFLLSYFATVIGCMLSFIFFRKIIRYSLYKIFKAKTQKHIEKIMTKISNIDFNALVILLAMPFTPAFVINIAAGLSNIKTKKYFIALLISKISIIYFWGYIGTSILSSFTDIIVLIKAIIIVAIAYIVSKIVEIIYQVEE